MKRKIVPLMAFGLLALASCFGPNHDYGDIQIINNPNDNETENLNNEPSTSKIPYYAAKVEASCPFVQDYSIFNLFNKLGVYDASTNEKVTNFDDFTYTFTCYKLSNKKIRYKEIIIPKETMISDAYQLLKNKYQTDDVDRYFVASMTDSNGITFTKNFYYDYFLPNSINEVNYPQACIDMKIPQYEGENIQYYMYDTSNTSMPWHTPFGLKIYGTNKNELTTYYEKLVQEGFDEYIPKGFYDDVAKYFYKDIDNENTLSFHVVSSCNRVRPLTNTFEYNIENSVTFWPTLIKKAKTNVKEDVFPQELLDLGIPHFEGIDNQFIYEKDQQNKLFIYNTGSEEMYNYSKVLIEDGFIETTSNSAYLVYKKYFYENQYELTLTLITETYDPYQVFEISIN